eukprot:1383560-Alexandrium_andersonii.AAC.1
MTPSATRTWARRTWRLRARSSGGAPLACGARTPPSRRFATSCATGCPLEDPYEARQSASKERRR